MKIDCKKVVIIDDEIDSCVLLKSFLSQLKFEVHTALTLKDGLRLVDEISPCIIFLDNNLPDGLGWSQVDYIQSKLPECKINLVSAYHYDAKTIRAKGVKIFEKPFSLSNIKSHLSSL